MIDTKQYTKTHELYTQFSQWLGVDGKVDSNYFMINYSLHAAESYIHNYYGINVSLDTIFEKVSRNSVFSPSNPPTKILNVFKSGVLSYPTISYLDSDSFTIKTSIGGYTTDMDFNGSSEDFYSTYLTGYVYTDTSDYSDIDFDDEYRIPSPRVYLSNDVVVQSPQTIFNSTTTIVIVGTPDSKVLINNTEVGSIGSDGRFSYDITFTQEVTTIMVKLQDPMDPTKESLLVKELFVLSDSPETPYLHILGYTKKVNTKTAKLLVMAPIGSSLTVNGATTITSELISNIAVPIVTTLESDTLTVNVSATKDSITSVTRSVRIDYNSTDSDYYLNELNKDYSYIPYIPEDLLIAVFKLANHFYNGTLYNNESIDTFRTANDISQKYTSHSIPSDVKKLLSTYTHYRP